MFRISQRKLRSVDIPEDIFAVLNCSMKEREYFFRQGTNCNGTKHINHRLKIATQ